VSKLLPLSELLPKTVDGLLVSPGLVPPVLDGRKTITRRMSAAKWMRRKKGDLLFLRENWRLAGYDTVVNRDCRLIYEADGASLIHPVRDDARLAWLEREADRRTAHRRKHGSSATPQDSAPLRPSLLLPRWASRCVLRLTEDPRLEHVQEITEEDAKREGMVLPAPSLPQCPCEDPDVEDPGPHLPHCLWRQEHVEPDESPYVAAFVCTWEGLHTKDGERWEDNPVVVRLTFERIA
jgi:hypothetical protein